MRRLPCASIALAFCVAACVAACSSVGSPAPISDQDASTDAAPMGEPNWPACDPSAATQTLTFVHVNDLHANYQLDPSGISPYARVRGYYEKVRAERPYTIFTNGGDDYEKGSIAEVLSQGASTRAILAAMQYDVRVVGNHDYAWSADEVLAMSHDAHANVLESNVKYTGTSAVGFGATDFVVRRVGCLKVGFAGLVSTPWNDQDVAVMQDFYPGFACNYDYVGQARAIVEAHRSEVDVMVFVNHIGLGLDGIVALAVPGIDVILSGHSHDVTKEPNVAKGTLIVQSGAFAQHINRLDVTYDLATRAITDSAFELVDIDASLAPDDKAQSTIAGVLQQYAPHASDAVAIASAPGTAASIADIAARAAMAKFSADAAVVDTETVWSPWPAGPVSQQSMLDAFKIERELPGTPGFNSFYTATVTGADLETIRAQATAGARFVAVLPATTDPAKTYLLALQKRPAYSPGSFFPKLVIAQSAYGSEAWEALDFFARQRAAACLYIDADTHVPNCP
jgi:2',3'-cyclic-nucleotide 2'-phosphodiesterase (5'-nucleotidase family)